MKISISQCKDRGRVVFVQIKFAFQQIKLKLTKYCFVQGVFSASKERKTAIPQLLFVIFSEIEIRFFTRQFES